MPCVWCNDLPNNNIKSYWKIPWKQSINCKSEASNMETLKKNSLSGAFII